MTFSPEVTVLCSLLSGIAMLGIGKTWGSNDKVDDTTCQERRESCKQIKELSFNRIEERLDEHDVLLKCISQKLDKIMLYSKNEHSK